MEKKGTVTSVSSIFPVHEAHQASKRVHDAIAGRQNQLNQLNGFIADNANLINLVHKLPDELHHDIMVPFGKAAFFPGRLVHTNEFTVLLGEGYYVERTSKQANDILRRRGKALDAQVESLKAIMKDLKMEASFFDTTASEALEGLVEIREDYIEEGSFSPLAKTGSKTSGSSHILDVDDAKVAAEDQEYACLFSRIAELEKEEEEEEEEEEAKKSHKSDGDEKIQNEVVDSSTHQISVVEEVRSSQVQASAERAVTKDVSSHGNLPARNSSTMDKTLELPEVNNKVQSPFTASNTAFTGSVIEHAPNMGIKSTEQTSGRSSKPVSRFKRQMKS